MKATKLVKMTAAAAMAITMTACSSGSASGSSSAAPAEPKTGVNSTYAYLLDTSDLEFPELDLSNAEGVLASVLEKGVLTIATSPDYPCREFIDASDNTLYGSEMMMAKYIADALGVDLAVEQMDFNATLAAVDTGKVDLAMSGYGWKKDREENYELSIGYVGDPNAESGHTLLIRAEDLDKYNSLEDFAGTHIIAQANSLQEMYATDQIVALDPENTVLEPVTSLADAIMSINADKCDAVSMDKTTAKQYAAQSEGTLISMAEAKGVQYDTSMYGNHEGNIAAAKKGETDLIETVNEIIQFVEDHGWYQEWYKIAEEQAGVGTDE